MSTDTPHRLRAGDRLPALELAAVPGGRPQRLRTASRDALVLILLPDDPEPWADALDALARAARDVEQWYARIRVAVAANLEQAAGVRERLGGRLVVLADPDGALHARTGIAPDRAALVIADRYGQVYEVAEAGAGETLPDTDAVVHWVKFLATQCPECGVIDEPGYGEWALS